jgi:hypothetical protein
MRTSTPGLEQLRVVELDNLLTWPSQLVLSLFQEMTSLLLLGLYPCLSSASVGLRFL